MTTYSTNTSTHAKNARITTLKQRLSATAKTVEFRIFTIFVTVLMLWGAAIATFGYPALILVALAIVPIMFFVLWMITVGK
jgi:hypothetical protein